MNLRSLQLNLMSNYIGSGYVIILTLVTIPYYLEILGAEAYGLIGFFTFLQTALTMLDLGFNQFFGRQAAHAKGKHEGFVLLADLLKSLEVYFIALAFLLIAVSMPASSWMSVNWFSSNEIGSADIQKCLQLMLANICIQMLVRLYRNGILGFENQVWLNGALIFISTFRFLGALLFIIFISDNIVHFFILQLFIVCLELALLGFKFYHLLPAGLNLKFRFNLSTLGQNIPLAFSIAFTSFLWILTTQYDKFLLSKLLPLKEFGYFSLLAFAISGVVFIAVPIRQAIQPRLTFFIAQGKLKKSLSLYRQSSHYVSLLTGAFVVFLVFFAEPLFLGWTRDQQASQWVSQTLYLFALGNWFLAMQSILVALQIANGDLRIHLRATTFFFIVQVPLIYWAAIEYGVIGVGITWLALRIIFFLLVTPLVHKTFAKELHLSWLFRDVLPVFSIQLIVGKSLSSLITYQFISSSPYTILILAGLGLTILFSGILISNHTHSFLISKYNNWRVT
ncbi:uncharacterized protein METZ01_LOCUS175065 [marine metagenome]|uniref:Polysaccharide biosynthesis protein C-terminal domain-containing protein n=1 Tax=marine metagenome TaxID=408172 RepID=A0A382C946_9ZZZZ